MEINQQLIRWQCKMQKIGSWPFFTYIFCLFGSIQCLKYYIRKFFFGCHIKLLCINDKDHPAFIVGCRGASQLGGPLPGEPAKGIRLISSRVTKLSQRYNKNTCLTLVKHSFIKHSIQFICSQVVLTTHRFGLSMLPV